MGIEDTEEQCDLIWKIFATLAEILQFSGKFLRIISYLEKC